MSACNHASAFLGSELCKHRDVCFSHTVRQWSEQPFGILRTGYWVHTCFWTGLVFVSLALFIVLFMHFASLGWPASSFMPGKTKLFSALASSLRFLFTLSVFWEYAVWHCTYLWWSDIHEGYTLDIMTRVPLPLVYFVLLFSFFCARYQT